MATIDEIRRGIQVLHEKIVASEAKLEGLERQKNEDGLSNEAKKEIDGKIAFVRSDILLDKQQIVEDKRWIAAEQQRITAKEHQSLVGTQRSDSTTPNGIFKDLFKKERAISTSGKHSTSQIYLRLKSTSTMVMILEVREDIKALKQEIVALNKKIVASETKLEKLNQQKIVDGLSTAAKKEIGDEIAFIRSNTLEHNQQIVEHKRQIAAKEEQIAAEKKEIATKEQRITATVQRITAKEQKDAAAKIIEARKGETSPFPDRTFPVPVFLTECTPPFL